jgi:FAD/FMN-containing dehydrogenase
LSLISNWIDDGSRSLRGRIAGSVALPGDADWDEQRVAWNLAADQHPVAVALPESSDDVVAIVEFARERGMRVAAQGTGHNATAIASLADTILVKTSRMRGVEIDPEARIARAEAGALWLDVTRPASEHGLAPLAGSSPDVGVVGYTLGGGLSWLGRKHGLASNSVTAIEIVTADARLRRVDAEHDSELFWALRGGGGNFGVVCAIEFELHPVPELSAGILAWPWERAGEVLRAWRAWVQDVPDEVTSVGRILQVPPLPDIPEIFRGRRLVVIEAAYLGGEAAGAELIAPLRDLGPEIDTFAPAPPVALSFLHNDPDHPVAGVSDHLMLGDMPAEAIDALVRAGGPGSCSPLLSLELRHLGGALARREADHGALPRIDGDFLLYGVGMAMTPEMAGALRAHFPDIRKAMDPWVAGREALNFVGHPVDSACAYDELTYRRLRDVKAKHDPSNVFCATHPIAPATSGAAG